MRSFTSLGVSLILAAMFAECGGISLKPATSDGAATGRGTAFDTLIETKEKYGT